MTVTPMMRVDWLKLRIIFLDIDGVLNSHKMTVLAGHWPNARENRKEGESYLQCSDGFDKYTIQLVNQLCKVTGAKIVLSTSWRDIFKMDDTLKMMDEIGIESRYIIGRTGRRSCSRGEQIEDFIKDLISGEEGIDTLMSSGLLLHNSEDVDVKVESYVILDDLDGVSVLKSQKRNLVKTDDFEGLTLKDTLRAGKILTNNKVFSIKDLQGLTEKGWSYKPNFTW